MRFPSSTSGSSRFLVLLVCSDVAPGHEVGKGKESSITVPRSVSGISHHGWGSIVPPLQIAVLVSVDAELVFVKSQPTRGSRVEETVDVEVLLVDDEVYMTLVTDITVSYTVDGLEQVLLSSSGLGVVHLLSLPSVMVLLGVGCKFTLIPGGQEITLGGHM